jgi:hypothetical protein
MPYTEDPGAALGPEVPWNAGSESRDNATLKLDSDILGPVILAPVLPAPPAPPAWAQSPYEEAGEEASS